MKLKCALFGLVLAWTLPQLLAADIFDYGSVEGDTVNFTQIMEISNTSSEAVYGAPLDGGGDTLSFVPLGFQGFVNGGIDFEEGRLTFGIEAQEGYVINSIEFLEASSFLLFGDESMVMSSSFGVANVDGELFSASSITEMHGDNVTGQNSFQSGFTIDLPSVDQASFILDSQILAAALGSNELATLSKDAIVIRVNTSAVSVPEPSAICILAAVGMTAVVSRRRKN